MGSVPDPKMFQEEKLWADMENETLWHRGAENRDGFVHFSGLQCHLGGRR